MKERNALEVFTRLKSELKKRGIKDASFAKKIGKTRQTFSSYRKNGLPSKLDYLVSQTLGWSLNRLRFDIDEPDDNLNKDNIILGYDRHAVMDKINKRLKFLGLDNQFFYKGLKCSATIFYSWKKSGFPLKRCMAAAELLDVEYDWLVDGVGIMNNETKKFGKFLKEYRQANNVPFSRIREHFNISKEDLFIYEAGQDLPSASQVNFIRQKWKLDKNLSDDIAIYNNINQERPLFKLKCPVPCSDNTFGVVYETISMAPDYNGQEILFINPKEELENNNDVVFIYGKKTYLRRAVFENDEIFLTALNHNFAEKIFNIKAVKVIGKVICSVKLRSGKKPG